MPVYITQSSTEAGHRLAADYDSSFLDETNNQLAVIYNQILRFVQRDAKKLLDAAARVGTTRRAGALDTLHDINIIGSQEKRESDNSYFDIMATVIWPEIGNALLEDLGETIFATGKPDELFKVRL